VDAVGLFAASRARYAAYVLMYFARKPLSVLKPVLGADLGLTRSQLGGIDTAFLAA